jgi:hypothetical protein
LEEKRNDFFQKQSDRRDSEPKLASSSEALKGKGVLGWGLEPITNYRVKHVNTHFFIGVPFFY